MSKYGIIVNADDCVGCHACFVACKEENQVAFKGIEHQISRQGHGSDATQNNGGALMARFHGKYL